MLKLLWLMKRFFVLLSLVFIFFLSANQINAAAYNCDPTNGTAGSGVQTAIGCISTSADGSGGFFESIIRLFVGLGGGLALILMLYGVFIVTTSAGIPDKLKEGSEIITSAIAGLIFVLLSVFLLNLIGINILGLPGLT